MEEGEESKILIKPSTLRSELPEIGQSVRDSRNSEMRAQTMANPYLDSGTNSRRTLFEGGTGDSPPKKEGAPHPEEMESFIKTKFHTAKNNTGTKKEFVGLRGEKNPDQLLKKMVDKIVKE